MAGAILLAAGTGSRMKAGGGSGENKMLRTVRGESVLSRSLRALLAVPAIERVAVVVSDSTRDAARELIARLDAVDRCVLVHGGVERSDSVYAGLLALEGVDIVAIHDGARCLAEPVMISRTIESAKERGSGVAMMPAKDTIKRMNGDVVAQTLARSELCIVQTPQTFRYVLVRRAYDEARAAGIAATDDAALVERLGEPVYMVEGSYDNIKITTQEDIAVAEAILRGIPAGEGGCGMIRVGYGEDTHRLVESRALILGGVRVPHETGLLGHSDADVLVHAVIDALLGAAALGDIGRHFPDSDARYAGADSLGLLAQAADLLRREGFRVCNLDTTIVAQKPKLAPHIEQMRENIARAAKIAVQQVSVKATTSEGLGFEGRCEGMTARCVALVERVR